MKKQLRAPLKLHLEILLIQVNREKSHHYKIPCMRYLICVLYILEGIFSLSINSYFVCKGTSTTPKKEGKCEVDEASEALEILHLVKYQCL